MHNIEIVRFSQNGEIKKVNFSFDNQDDMWDWIEFEEKTNYEIYWSYID